jgi:hypothetical protein
MKDQPLDLMAPWRLVLLAAYVMLIFPVAALAGAAWGRLAPPASCGICRRPLTRGVCSSCGVG